MHERIHKRSRPRPGRWMHHHPGRFIHHDKVFVFVDYIDRDWLCHQINLYRLPDDDLDHIAFGNGRLGRDYGVPLRRTALSPEAIRVRELRSSGTSRASALSRREGGSSPMVTCKTYPAELVADMNDDPAMEPLPEARETSGS